MRLLLITLQIIALFSAAGAAAQTIQQADCEQLETVCEAEGADLPMISGSEAQVTVYEDVEATIEGRDTPLTETEKDWLNDQSFGSGSLFEITR